MQRHQPSWLKDAIFYQIYPQSFYDTNSDGIGDLPGIIEKLDYIRSLGCNAIWLNPVFVSPFRDAGYDVSDFCRVDPRYGNNDDMVRLFEEAHRRGIRVVLDLVAGHTSVEHPWFVESAKAERNEWTNRYLWIEPVWKDAPPELRTITGWGERNGAFVTNFFWCQPALNYGYADPDPAHPWELPVSHPDCQATMDELRKIMAYWLDLGADGFRVDMAQSLIRGHDPELRRKALMELWQGIRAWFDQDYPEAVLVAEWSFPIHAIDAGFHIDFMIHFETVAYNSLFRNHRPEVVSGLERGESFFHSEGRGCIRTFLDIYLEHFHATRDRGYISIPTGNHDVSPRLAEGRTLDELKCAMLFLFTLPGIPFLYYGDEIGLRNAGHLPSKEGGYERTGARTPMQWSNSSNAGFSAADPAMLYLPVEDNPGERTVAAAEADEDSLLHFVRRLIACRSASEALGAEGEFLPLYAEERAAPFVFERSHAGERYWIAVNPTSQPVEAEWPAEVFRSEKLAVSGAELISHGDRAVVRLAGAGYGLWKIEDYQR